MLTIQAKGFERDALSLFNFFSLTWNICSAYGVYLHTVESFSQRQFQFKGAPTVFET